MYVTFSAIAFRHIWRHLGYRHYIYISYLCVAFDSQPLKNDMKTFYKTATYSILAIALFGAVVIQIANDNYINAMDRIALSDYTDGELQDIMYSHGFRMDANKLDDPTMSEKIAALILK